MRRTALEAVLGDLQALKERPDSAPTLAQIDVPILILHGEQDQLIPLDEARAMASTARRARLVTLPEAGHLPNLEQPEQFNAEVLQWIRSLE